MKLKNANEFTATFAEMGLGTPLCGFLEQSGFKNPTEIQSKAIPVALTGKDIIAVAQTGSGKTLAYGLSLLTRLKNNPDSRALVLAPNREVAQQIFRVFTSLVPVSKVEPCLVVGGIKGDQQYKQLNKLPRLIIANPGRLYDHLLANKLLLKNVDQLVIDEADRMMDMGFLPQLNNIKKTMRGEIQTMMYCASLNEGVEKVASTFIKSEALFVKTTNAEAPVSELKQKILYVEKKDKNDLLLDVLNQTKNKVLVFVADQDRSEFIGKFLEEFGFKSQWIHGSLSAGHRNRVLKDFREKDTRIIVGTDLLARGLDVADVDTVINFDFPFETEDFLHRIGRTARAGKSGLAITFVTEFDERRLQRVRKYIINPTEVKKDPNFRFNIKDVPHPLAKGRHGQKHGGSKNGKTRTKDFDELKNRKTKFKK